MHKSPKKAINIGSRHSISKSMVMRNLVLNDTIIRFSTSVKYLGIMMDQTPSWSEQVADVSRKFFTSLRSLKRLQYFLPQSTIMLIRT